jgi:phosphatidylglycerophosphatase A
MAALARVRTGAAGARAIASLGGVGHVGVAPGTVASLLAAAAGAGLLAWHPAALWIGIVLAVAGGLAAVAAARVDGDPGWVVIDEVAGQWIALLPVARAGSPGFWAGGFWPGAFWQGGFWPGILLAFALFRLFDIAKPGPVGWADRQTGAFGIMADDVVAGLLAALLGLAARVALGALR